MLDVLRFKATQNAYVITQQSINDSLRVCIKVKFDFFKFRVKSSDTTKMPEQCLMPLPP